TADELPVAAIGPPLQRHPAPSRRERLDRRPGHPGEEVVPLPTALDPRPLSRLVGAIDLRQRERSISHRDLTQVAEVPAVVAALRAGLPRTTPGVAEVVVRHEAVRALDQRLADSGKAEPGLDVARGGRRLM